MKKALILLLALLMCTSVLFGCSDKPDDSGNTGTVDTGDAGDGLGNHNFNNANFTILSRSQTNYEHVGAAGGDSVKEAVFRRNQKVMERFGVNLTTTELDGGYDSRAGFVNSVRAEHMTSTGAYDLISTHSVYLGWFGTEGILTDLEALPSVDLTKDYWNQNIYNELNINGSCYIMIGDIAHTLYEYIGVMFVNTNILTENKLIEGGIDGLYDMVEAGDWTWGELYEMAEKYGNGQDSYGLLFNIHAMRAAIVAQDASLYVKDASTGRYSLPASASQHLVNAVENLAKLFRLNNMYFAEGWGPAEGELNPMFISKTALFYGQMLGQSASFATEMGEGYAVVPIPKFDTLQENYLTICRDTVSAVAVMENAKNKEMSGVVTQALAYYGAEYVTPEYYEKTLKYRYANDPRCPEILELIRNSLTIEPVGTYFETSIDSDMFTDIVKSGSNGGVSSKYGSYVDAGNTALKNFYNKIEIIQS